MRLAGLGVLAFLIMASITDPSVAGAPGYALLLTLSFVVWAAEPGRAEASA
jgi:hypothetical protein